MAYVNPNFPTKKKLADALVRGTVRIQVWNPNMPKPNLGSEQGPFSVEGPWNQAPAWHARVEVIDGFVVRILQ